MTAIKTAFGGRVPLVDLDQGTPVPRGFVFQLLHKLTPSDIAYSFRKAVVLDHILDGKTLNAYDLVLAYDVCRELMQKITPSIDYPGMNACDFQLSETPVLGAFFLFRVSSLSFCQF